MTAMVMMTMTVLSEYIQRQLRRQGMDVAELARQAKLSESTVRPIARGSTKLPDLVTLQTLAGPLGVSVESMCRAALGLIPEAPEIMPVPSEARKELLSIFDDLDPEEQQRAVNALKALFD